MKVTVKLIGPLIYKAGFSEKEFSLPVPATPQDLLSRLAIDTAHPVIITRNGKAVALSEHLQDGDRVAISPLYSGG